MKKSQISQLMLLGYEETQEDGAILEHPKMSGLRSYVWEDETFEDVLRMFEARFEYSIKRTIANSIV